MLDLPIIDPHHHLWRVHNSYPWLEGPPNPERFTGDDSAIHVDYLPADYRDDFAGLNWLGSVHVDAGAGDALGEAVFIQELHDTCGVPTAAVAAANLLSPDVNRHLEALSDISTVRGIRHILNWHPSANYTYVPRNDIMKDSTWQRNFARLAGLGFSFDLQVYPGQLADAAELARTHADTSIILNHTGMPLGTDEDSVARWRAGIDSLATLPNTSIKISGIGMTIHPWTTDSMRPFVRHAIEAFGTNRAMFASNFPVDRLYSDLTSLYAAFDELTADLSAGERRALFAESAVDIYRLPKLTDSIRMDTQ